MEKTYKPAEFVEALTKGEVQEGLAIVGMVKLAEEGEEALFFSPGRSCATWRKIPLKDLEQVEFLYNSPCKDHEHPVVRLYLKQPTGPASTFHGLLKDLVSRSEQFPLQRGMTPPPLMGHAAPHVLGHAAPPGVSVVPVSLDALPHEQHTAGSVQSETLDLMQPLAATAAFTNAWPVTYNCGGVCTGGVVCHYVYTAPRPIIQATAPSQIGSCVAALQVDPGDSRKLHVYLAAQPGTPIGSYFSCSKTIYVYY